VDHIFVGGALGVNFLAAAGHDVGGSARFVDMALQPVLKDLLNKAQRSPTNLLLPVDLIIGEACVTRDGVEPPPKPPGQEQEEEEDEEDEEEGLLSRTQSVAQTAVDEEEEDVDPAAGFDYDYEVRGREGGLEEGGDGVEG
jgi:3-phosphoglycerate kinase